MARHSGGIPAHALAVRTVLVAARTVGCMRPAAGHSQSEHAAAAAAAPVAVRSPVAVAHIDVARPVEEPKGGSAGGNQTSGMESNGMEGKEEEEAMRLGHNKRAAKEAT